MPEIILTEEVDLEGKKFVTGFHGIGWTGYIANRYLITKINARRIGYLSFEGMRPVVRLWNRRISYPHDLYLSEGEVFLVSEAPFPEAQTMEITGEIASWVKKCGFELSIVIGGLTSAVKRKDDPDLMGVATSAASQLMDEYGIQWMLDDLNIVGPLAGLLFHAERLGLPLIALLPFSENRPDRRAAVVAIEKLGEILGMEVDTTDLIRAEELERRIEQMITAQLKEEEKPSHHYM